MLELTESKKYGSCLLVHEKTKKNKFEEYCKKANYINLVDCNIDTSVMNIVVHDNLAVLCLRDCYFLDDDDSSLRILEKSSITKLVIDDCGWLHKLNYCVHKILDIQFSNLSILVINVPDMTNIIDKTITFINNNVIKKVSFGGELLSMLEMLTSGTQITDFSFIGYEYCICELFSFLKKDKTIKNLSIKRKCKAYSDLESVIYEKCFTNAVIDFFNSNDTLDTLTILLWKCFMVTKELHDAIIESGRIIIRKNKKWTFTKKGNDTVRYASTKAIF